MPSTYAVCALCGQRIRQLTVRCKSPCCGSGFRMMRAKPRPIRETQVSIAMRVMGGMGATFSESDLIVALWKEDPERFGMKGHDLPNAKTVAVLICVLIRKGLLVRTGVRTYASVKAKRRVA
jgi:hypothetical protein